MKTGSWQLTNNRPHKHATQAHPRALFRQRALCVLRVEARVPNIQGPTPLCTTCSDKIANRQYLYDKACRTNQGCCCQRRSTRTRTPSGLDQGGCCCTALAAALQHSTIKHMQSSTLPPCHRSGWRYPNQHCGTARLVLQHIHTSCVLGCANLQGRVHKARFKQKQTLYHQPQLHLRNHLTAA